MKRVIFLAMGLMTLLVGCSTHCHPPRPVVALSTTNTTPAPPIVTKPTKTNQWSTNWTELFDGKTMKNWAATEFAGHSSVNVESNQMTIAVGLDLNGVTWTNGSLPKVDYEIALDAIKIDGSDFFCGLTFPVKDSSCSFIVGGWGGGVIGLSSIDDMDASENEQTKNRYLEAGKWFPIRVRVTTKKIEAWVGDEKMADQEITGHKVSLRPGEIYRSEPLGIATFQTTAGVKNIRLRLVHD